MGRRDRFRGSIADWITSHKGPISYDRRLLIPHGKAIMAASPRDLKQVSKAR